MKCKPNRKKLKVIGILLMIIYLPFLLFYVGVAIPEYCACEEWMYEGQRGVDIWGNEVLCDGESQAFGKMFFQLATGVFISFSIVIGLVFFFMYRWRK
ncbi:hypothetical protein VUJ46_07765 [Chryseobacterium sp. MYb264]|uniref:hypothetical protein n=1 Tax=Chryseobacterium sp. MYb264 TaxID=2745153 RepID=UPI002E12BC93|nr:hypothetical protein VUJ46_07765 [Chryseobacterium sp. MYb264]